MEPIAIFCMLYSACMQLYIVLIIIAGSKHIHAVKPQNRIKVSGWPDSLCIATIIRTFTCFFDVL